MRVNLVNTVEKFSAFTAKLGKFSESKLVSFAFKIDGFDLLSTLNRLLTIPGPVFLFQCPDSKYAFIALDSILEISAKNQMNVSDSAKKFSRLKSGFISNWDDFNLESLPILCTSIKFDPVKTSEDWMDFNTVNIYIPSIIFYKNRGNTFGSYNFIYNEQSDIDFLKSNFSNRLKLIAENTEADSREIRKNDNYSFMEDEEQKNAWKIISVRAMEMISGGEVEKLVVSRPYRFGLKHNPYWSALLKELSDRFPDCYLFFLRRNQSVFFGSSPELFLKIFGNLAEVESVAGSAPRGGKYNSDEILESVLKSSSKNHKEHEYVTDFISNTLKKFSDKVIKREEKQIKKLENIQHLTTKITAELKSNTNHLELIDSLFPTPAVCGLPKEKAMSIIRMLEAHDRGLYSGLVGWMDFDGNCELAAAIRSTLVKNNFVTAYAGAGLINGSDPEDEFIETRLKLDTILSLFRTAHSTE